MNLASRARQATVVMAGMPKTGKSTFLGALYHVLETEAAQGVTLDILPEARQHLEGLRGRWLRVEREDRTPKVSPVLNELQLRLQGDEARLSVRWPDLSGEYFDDMVRKRALNRELAKLLEEATALVVFVHPDTVTQQPRIRKVDRVAQAVAGETLDDRPREDRVEGATPVDWDPMMIPGQVLVVELIQLLLGNWLGPPLSGVSVVLSAWDLVSATYTAPNVYLREQLPLLSQFLEANSDRSQFEIFGVSALGGDPEEDRQRLQGEIDPRQRIRVVRADGTTAEDGILAPIRWLIE